MEYRKMSNLGISPSLLGFGCMRFPKLEDDSIDELEAEKMIDKAISAGITYIDTAYPYHDGKSEPFVGKVLKKYKRDSFYLATKLPIWKINSLEEAKNVFQEQLERLQVEYVDFYLFHAMDKDRWNKVLDLKLIPYFEQLQKEGKIKFLGFSFHDEYEVFEEMITYRKWDFCQIQYNYMDTEIQAGKKGYDLAEKLGVPLVIMEPIKGGSLAILPEDIENMFKEVNPDASVASWALRWVASHSNVKVILSGMSTYEQLTDNLETFDQYKSLDVYEENVVNEVAKTIKSRMKNGCTACGYCMPCPFAVDIPHNFAIWNQLAMYGNKEAAKRSFFVDMKESARADMCQECGACEEECPQSILIRDDLKKIVEEFSVL